jgi:hypothetical protein
MIPYMMLLLLEDDGIAFDEGIVSPTTPFYGYFPPNVTIFKDNRILLTRDNRIDIIKDNRARITVT